jgi:hypothetical protein
MKKTTWPGNWKVQCQSCGLQYPSSEILRRWDGLLVCKKDYEPRHPQTLIKLKAETAVPDFVSAPVNPDVFVFFCDIFMSSGYADMAAADCARADSLGSLPYATLHDLTTNGHTIT